MLIKAITLYRLRAVSDFLFHFVLWLTLMKRQFVTLRQYILNICYKSYNKSPPWFNINISWHTSDVLLTVLIHLRHTLCLSEYAPSRPFWHILCVSYRLWMRPKLKVFWCAPHAHTHAHTHAHAHTSAWGTASLVRIVLSTSLYQTCPVI